MVKSLPDFSLSHCGYSNSKPFHPQGFTNRLISSIDSYCAINWLVFLPNGKRYSHKVQKMIPYVKPSELGGGKCYKQSLSMGPLLLDGPVNGHRVVVHVYRAYRQWYVLHQYFGVVHRHSYPGTTLCL